MKNIFKKLFGSNSWGKHFSETVQRVGKNNAGFSLVELIVVIAIMAVLAAVAVIGVSIYIPKAQKAADDELLNVLTDALVAACMSEGVDQRDVRATIAVDANGNLAMTNGNIDIRLSAATGKTLTEEQKTEIIKLFNEIYNDDVALNRIADATLMFDGNKFIVGDSNFIYADYNGSVIKVSKEQLELLVNSNFGDLGAETLLTEVGSVAGWGSLNLNGGDNYWRAVATYYNLGDFEGLTGAELSSAVFEAMYKSTGTDENSEEGYEQVLQMNANAMALYAAQNTKDVTIEGVTGWLNGGKTADDLKDSSSARTLAEAAAIYGLYMSYAESKGEDFDNQENDPQKVMGIAMGDKAFAEWVATEEGKEEFVAYKASMSIISDAAEEDDARESILTNGFDDPDLIKLLEDMMGK